MYCIHEQIWVHYVHIKLEAKIYVQNPFSLNSMYCIHEQIWVHYVHIKLEARMYIQNRYSFYFQEVILTRYLKSYTCFIHKLKAGVRNT